MIELLEKYPKAAKVVRQYYLEKLIESLKTDLPEEFKEHVRQQGVTDEMVAKLVDNQPRSLFDVFDENELYIHVGVLIGINNSIVFKYQVNDLLLGPVFKDGVSFKTRRESEKAAIEEAFKLLEEKL